MKRSSLAPLALVLPLLPACVLVSAETEEGSRDRRTLNAAGRTDELPYSQAVLAGDTLWIAGTLGVDAETGAVPEDVEREIRLCLDGVRDKLALAGMGMDDLVSVQVFCSDPALYETFNAIYRTYFEESFPARAFVGSGPLLRGARFEVNGVAVRP